MCEGMSERGREKDIAEVREREREKEREMDRLR